ncbi:MAG: hypothetical protein NTW87_18250, partial [Planctomycetota bacterium]|nr:hypothetical protein [Planctomycetota bacterium]
LRDRDLKQLGRDQVGDFLIERAQAAVQKIDLSEGARFLESNFGMKTACAWVRHKFGIELAIDEIRGLDVPSFKLLVREKAPKEEPKPADGDVTAVYKSLPPEAWLLPLALEESYHLPHLVNFFDAIRKGTPLNCPGEVGYLNAVTVIKINDAVAAGKKLEYTPAEFTV